jgi:hypothetical protein
VASSSSKIFGLATRTRAMAIRCYTAGGEMLG